MHCSRGGLLDTRSWFRCNHLVRRYISLLAGCIILLYVYKWRNYLAIVLSPHPSFKYRQHHAQLHAAANASLVAALQEELTRSLPAWISDYARWHARVRAVGAKEATPLLIVSVQDHHSGGLADRLRSLPFFVWEAARAKRLILMQWANPCPLEEFLLPPLGGIDWTVPAELDQSNAVWCYCQDESCCNQLAGNTSTMIKTTHNEWTFRTGMRKLAAQMNVSSLSDPVFSNIFRLLFTPSPPVQALLDETMGRLGLAARNFDAVHLRARYPGTSPAFEKPGLFSRTVDADGMKWTRQAKEEIRQLFVQAIDCLPSNVSSSKLPIYFASDTNEAVRMITHERDAVTGFVTPYEKFHLNRNDHVGIVRKTPPSAFYPAFVDLWVLSMARCLSIGAGGYGIVASIIGETECVVFHQPNAFVRGGAKICPEITRILSSRLHHP
mmetsp:Transcript_20783/g.60474  ORF Transcript_20783/g.60474 Transcript_20783/m.60474 type:complete len:439 (-) Transcript_20783:443-1759(-)